MLLEIQENAVPVVGRTERSVGEGASPAWLQARANTACTGATAAAAGSAQQSSRSSISALLSRQQLCNRGRIGCLYGHFLTRVMFPALQRQHAHTRLLYLAAATGALLLVTGVYGFAFLGRAFSNSCTQPCAAAQGYEGCLDWVQFIAAMTCIYVGPVAFYLFGATVIELNQMRSFWPRLKHQHAILLAFCVTFVLMVLSWVYLLKPSQALNKTKYGSNTDDALLVLLGGFGMFILTAFTIVLGLQTLAAYSPSFARRTFITPYNGLSGVNFRTQMHVLGAMVVFTALCFTATTAFSAVWNFSARSYWRSDSPYSLFPLSSRKVSDVFIFKVYEDCVIYYLFILILIVAGTLCHVSTTLRRITSKRFRVPGFTKEPLFFTTGVTVGELIILTLTFSLFIVWVWFWRYHYDRIANETEPHTFKLPECCPDGNAPCSTGADPHGGLQIWSRVFGHLTTLAMSFLLLPVTRNSAWIAIFGISFERAVKYHRALGVVTWVFVTIHMMLWDIKWLYDGSLGSNILTLDNLEIMPNMFHYDNFTVPMVEFAWAILTIMVSLALWKRRDNYELFYYVHQFGIIFYLVAIAHAWTFWYYAVGGLVLWLFDRMCRLYRGSQVVENVQFDFNESCNVTRIAFPSSTFHHTVAQYVFVNVPEISQFEWHPFTISSPPSDATRTLHIKDMGPHTFTHLLAERVRASSEQLSLRLDGPYGHLSDFGDCSHIVMIAGGIGATPFMSMLGEMYERSSSKRLAPITKVHLVWVVREPGLFAAFADVLNQAYQESTLFEISLYCTSDEDTHSSVAVPISSGRPPLRDLLRSVPSGPCANIMVCGPTPLIELASNLALENSNRFHAEEFFF
eukprot:m.82450 g.82450  ORF g.82450 m.82450 type:complete len:853 (+) comp8261_c0_seq5:72-2630(+)